ncbi:TIGR03086 family metal-binding protein [Streptomyces sp. NPDC002928]|uniref:TIGR03086 family metal-binding protein n=1 Tax=Streptomyces sp. NPDC002928 TaxID=3154440 RepID=UPI0033A041BF
MAEIQGVEALTRSHDYLREVATAVPEGAWAAPTPCSAWTARQVLNHARIDQRAFGLVLTGGRPDSDPFQPADALAGDPVAELDKVLASVADGYAQLPAEADQVPTPLGPLPLAFAAAAAAMDAAVHAWDIAVATGQNRPLPDDLAEGIRPAADRLVNHLRDAYQVFAPAEPLREGYGSAEALLAFLGRDPRWTPPAA